MTTYLTRSAWTSTAAAGAALTGSELVGVAVHWPGTAQAAIGDPGQEKIAERLRSYRNYHVNTRGWSDIGYNFAIDQGGRVWMCRSTQWRGNRVGAHCASATNPRANHKYVGVLLLLGQSEAPSAKMVAAFRDWFHNRFLPGWPGRTDVRGHRQVPGALTNCPGNRAVAAIPILTAKPASSSGGGSGGVVIPPPPNGGVFDPEEEVALTADDKEWFRYTMRAIMDEKVFQNTWRTDEIKTPDGWGTPEQIAANPTVAAESALRAILTNVLELRDDMAELKAGEPANPT